MTLISAAILPFEETGTRRVALIMWNLSAIRSPSEVRARRTQGILRQANSIHGYRSYRCFRAAGARVDAILPPMLEAAALISARRPEIQFVVMVAPSRTSDEVRDIARATRATPLPLPSVLHISTGSAREALAASDVAAVASGTATLEAALLGTPMVIVYKESTINWHTLGG